MKDALIEELELSQEQVDLLGEAELRWCDPVVGQTLAMIVKNKASPTADLEGVYEIEHCLKNSGLPLSNKDNLPIVSEFILRSSVDFPACATILLTGHMDAVHRRNGSLVWPAQLVKGFLRSGVNQPYQVEAICNLIAKITKKDYFEDKMKLVLRFGSSESQDNVVALLSMVYSAVQKGVTPKGKTAEETQAFIEERFMALMAPDGYEVLTRIIRNQVLPQLNPDLSQEDRAARINQVINPMFDLSVKTASKSRLFGDDICEMLIALRQVLVNTGSVPKAIRLYEPKQATSFVLECLRLPADELANTFKPKLKKRSITTSARLNRISEFLESFTAVLAEKPFEADQKAKAYTNLFISATQYMIKLKDREEVDSDRLLNILAPHVDLVEIRKGAKPSVKAFLFDYMIRHHRDLVATFSNKERGKFLESELGL
jgi:hypothetical protein